jgi:hypothetical protein
MNDTEIVEVANSTEAELPNMDASADDLLVCIRGQGLDWKGV